jgi:hypothetical protein
MFLVEINVMLASGRITEKKYIDFVKNMFSGTEDNNNNMAKLLFDIIDRDKSGMFFHSHNDVLLLLSI